MNDQPDKMQRVLAIDTATRVQSLALMDGETVLEHSQRRVKFNHGSTLLEHLSQTLDEHKLEVADLDLVSVGVGPGSFTGLRVGLAIAKSLSRAESIPIVGVSTLAALAHSVAITNPTAIVCPMYDARRREVYAGFYRWDTPRLEQLEPDQTIAPAELRDRILHYSSTVAPVVLVGNAPRKYSDELDVWEMANINWEAPDVSVMPSWTDAPSAVSVALLGRRKARSGELDDLASLEPNYIRPTDAEKNLKD